MMGPYKLIFMAAFGADLGAGKSMARKGNIGRTVVGNCETSGRWRELSLRCASAG
jgi:hypothetical protein